MQKSVIFLYLLFVSLTSLTAQAACPEGIASLSVSKNVQLLRHRLGKRKLQPISVGSETIAQWLAYYIDPSDLYELIEREPAFQPSKTYPALRLIRSLLAPYQGGGFLKTTDGRLVGIRLSMTEDNNIIFIRVGAKNFSTWYNFEDGPHLSISTNDAVQVTSNNPDFTQLIDYKIGQDYFKLKFREYPYSLNNPRRGKIVILEIVFENHAPRYLSIAEHMIDPGAWALASITEKPWKSWTIDLRDVEKHLDATDPDLKYVLR